MIVGALKIIINLIVSLEIITSCIRPQFVWDHKSSGKWLLANVGRELIFDKDLGILVFIHLATIHELPLEELRILVHTDQESFRLMKESLFEILNQPSTKFQLWQRKQILVKSGLVVNLIRFKQI